MGRAMGARSAAPASGLDSEPLLAMEGKGPPNWAARILEYPTMLHAKAFVRDGQELLAGTFNLEAWSLKRFFEIDVQVRSTAVARQFDERFSAPAEAISRPGRRLTGRKERLRARAFATISPLL
jgi:phosphatidylserine/phosphatidylglycerophosphate/cardiolipin synthase-like enzyme